jgi:membrane-associated protease RseP (regulator of RpoE activity)
MNQEEQEITGNHVTESAASTQLVIVAQLRRQLTDLMRVDSHTVQKSPDEVIAFRGRIDGDTEAAFEHIIERLATLGYTAMLQNAPGGGHEVVAVKGEFDRRPGQVWANVALFLVTLFSVLYISAINELDPRMVQGLNDMEVMALPLTDLSYLLKGLPFACALMSILLTHELSHYFVARRHSSPTSLPYFIPFPNLFGTMGAVIVQRKPTRNRKALFDIGVAGPLGGLIIAVPLLVLGLLLSDVQPPPTDVDVVLQEGNSLLYLGIKYLIFGRILPSNGEDVWLHPVAFAAWGGLWLTMMNLVPVGQLDGGHVSYALLGGRRAQTLGRVAIIAMIAWGGWTWMSGNAAGSFWLVWGFMNMFFNPHHPPPLNDATRLDWRRIALGLLVLVIFVLLFMPAPLRQVQL